MHDPDFDPYLPPRAPLGFEKPKAAAADVPGGSPWVTIWTMPRGTIRGIISTDPARNVLLLGALMGIQRAFDQAIAKDLGDKFELPQLLVFCLIGGAIGGVLMLYLFGLLVGATGGWLGGRASGEEVRSALAWGAVPQTAILLLYIPEVALFGRDLFRGIGPLGAGGQSMALVFTSMALIQLVLLIWGLVTTLKCLGEVQGFSAWMALLNVILAAIIFMIIVFAVVFVFMMAFLRPGG